MQFEIESKHPQGCYFQHTHTWKPMKFAENSNGKTSMNLWKWRNRAVGMHTALCRQQDVARQFNIHPSTFSWLLSRFRVTRQVSTHQRYRRQLKTTVYQDHFIVTTLRCNSFLSASKVANKLHQASGVRIWGTGCHVQDVNFRIQRPLVAIHLTQSHCQTHVAWATIHLRWTLQQWNAVLFTNEFRFRRDFANGSYHRSMHSCLERMNWAVHPKNVIQRDRYGGGSVMILGKIGHYGKTNLVKVNGTPNSQPYCEGILVHEVVPFPNQGQVTIFQQDNAWPRTLQDRPKMFYGITISMYWNDP
jgi:hypothetical protein